MNHYRFMYRYISRVGWCFDGLAFDINPFLSKCPYHSNFYAFHHQKKFRFFLCLFRIISFYPEFIVRFIKFIFSLIVFKMFGRPQDQLDFHFIDTYISSKKAVEKGGVFDSYLPGLEEEVARDGGRVAYLAKLSSFNSGLIDDFLLVRTRNSFKHPIFFSQDFITFRQSVSIFVLGILYPIRIVAVVAKLLLQGRVFLANCFGDSIRGVVFEGLVRHFVGNSFGHRSTSKRIYSFCEYKLYDRVFYKAVHRSSDIQIFGCQFFVDYPMWINTKIHYKDVVLGLAPDFLLVNSRFNLGGHTHSAMVVGQSLRYGYLFENTQLAGASQYDYLVLLPMDGAAARSLVDAVVAAGIPGNRVCVRPHPASSIGRVRRFVPRSWSFVLDQSLVECILKSRVVVGSGSGTLLEAAVLGRSTVVVNLGGPMFANPFHDLLSDTGLWKVCLPEELGNTLVRTFEESVKLDSDTGGHHQRLSEAEQLRSLMFARRIPGQLISVFNRLIEEKAI